ncbi:prolyl oligopeptidase family serine peptidase [Pelagicoccus enzymogenes]|uniref:alpha/beta hydrolase family protein n=1 Tax=Pelagicoccus enzymogenes TaxID=2773457 RepID=UPI00280D6404|nr:alpha/beta fold hydrolase [Pelagicoccus enzymogenes]MDQ8197645.1 prolyl oligopeptidase family serine peptidase [Pelagicoccus enzymogenes]
MKFLLLLLLGSLSISSGFANKNYKTLAKELFKQPDVSDVRLTPGNRGLSYLSSRKGISRLELLDLESGRTYTASVEDTPDIYDYYWIDRDTVLFFAQKLGTPIGAYTASYKLASVKPADFYRVYDTLPDTENLYIGKDDNFDEKFNDLYLINAKNGSRKRIEENDGTILAWFTDKDGVTRIRYTIDEYERDRYAYRSSADDDWRDIDINGHPVGVLFHGGPDEFIVFVRHDGDARFAAYTFNGAKNEYVDSVLEHEEYDILYNLIVVDPETEKTYGFQYDLQKPKTHWLDPEMAEISARIDRQHPATFNQVLGYDSEKRSVVYQRFSDKRPNEWLRFYIETGEEELLLQELPEIDTEQSAKTEPITYLARDGTKIHGYLTRATSQPTQPSKALLMIHGGPRARDRWGWDAEAQYFSKLGYHVLKINYRGSEGYGIEFSPYSHIDSIESSVRDTVDGARWLVDQGLASPGKIAIYGSSFGGHVSLCSAAAEPEIFFASMGYAGVYDWPTHLDKAFEEQPVYARLKTNTYYPDFEKNRAHWFAASALPQAEKISCPVFLIHGRSDETVSATQSRRMHKALKKAGKQSQLKILSFNRHGFTLEKNRISFYSSLAEFLEEASP